MSIFPIPGSITGKLIEMRAQLEVWGGVENFKSKRPPFFTVIKPRGIMFPFRRYDDLVPKNKKEGLIPTYLSYDQLSLNKDPYLCAKGIDIKFSRNTNLSIRINRILGHRYVVGGNIRKGHLIL